MHPYRLSVQEPVVACEKPGANNITNYLSQYIIPSLILLRSRLLTPRGGWSGIGVVSLEHPSPARPLSLASEGDHHAVASL